MAQNRGFTLIIMIWLTILTVWAVKEVTTSLSNPQSVSVSGIPGHPIPQQFSTVQINENTVWVVDANSNYIRVITHDQDGYHLTGSEMKFRER